MSASSVRRKIAVPIVMVGALALALTACSSSGSGSGGSSGNSSSPLKIAVVDGTSGTEALNGQQVNAGVKAAVAELNSHGGAAGHRIVVTYDNTGSVTSTAVQDLRTLSDNGIHFVIGSVQDPSCIAMAPIADQLGMVMVTPTCEDNALTTPKPPTGFFQVAPTDTGLANAVALAAAQAYPQFTHWVGSNPAFSFGYTFWPQFQKTLKASIPKATFGTPQYIPLSATTFTSYVTQMASQASKSNALVSSTFGDTLIGFIKAGEAVGLFNNFGGYLTPSVPDPILSALGPSVPDMWFSYVYYHSVFDNAANTALIKEFRAQNKGTYPDAWNEMAYVATQAIAAGVAKSHSTDANKVASAMAGLTLDGPTGSTTINKKTHIFEQGFMAIHVTPTSTGFKIVKSLTIPYSKFGN